MAKDLESTAKWKLDITQLKAGMQEAKRSISQANAEFKNATAGMGKWSSSVGGVEAKLKQLNKVSGEQRKILANLNEAYSKTVAELGEASPEAQKLKIQIENQEAAVKRTEAQIGQYNDKLSELQQEQERLNSPMGKLNSTIDEQESRLAELKEAYANATLEYGKNSDEAQQLANEIEQLSGELADNKRTLNEAEDAANEFDQSLENVDDSANNASSGGLSAVTVALGGLIYDGIQRCITALQDMATDVVNVGSQFDTSMSNVAALSGASADELERLREVAKEYGSSTQFSASQAADALGYMALAGWDANQSADALGGVLNLAAASGMDLAQASDMVTDYLSAFGMEASQSGEFADMLAYAQANANTTTAQLGEAFRNSAANMNAAGQDVQTTTALLAMMANQGLKGSEAGTALSAMMRDLTAKMEDGAIAIGDTSVAVMDAEGNYRDMNDILVDIEAATQGMGDAERAAALSSTFTSDSIRGLNMILASGTDELNGFEEELRNSGGSAEEMAAIMNDNLNGDLTALGSKLEGVQIALYEKLEPALRDGVEALSGLLDVVNWLIDHGNEVIGVLAAMGTAVAAYVAYTTALKVMESGWMSLTIVQKAVTAAQWLMNAAMAANPIGILIALIAALVAAFIYFFKTNEDFRNKVLEVWGNVKEFVGGVVDAIVGFFTETLPNGIQTMLDWFGQIPERIGAFIGGALASVATWATNMRDNAIATGQQFLSNIVNFFTQLPTKVGNFLTNTINRVKTWVSNMISNALSAGRNFLSNVVSFISSVPSKVGSFLSSTISKAATFASDMASKATQAGRDFFNNLKDKISELPSKMLSIGKDIVRGIWDGISGNLSWIKNKITGWVGDVTSFLKNLFGIGSPSRLMRDEIGQWLPKGIFAGWDAGLPDMLKGMRKGLDSAVDSLKGDVQVSASGITGGFGNGGGIGASGAPVGGAVYNFTQNITSQQPLSTLEIYRNTNSLLFKAKAGANV